MYYLNFNNVQNVFRKAIESGIDILHKRFYKMAGTPIGTLNSDFGIQLPLEKGIHAEIPSPKPQPEKHNSIEQLDFQQVLDQFDEKTYATFMMHLEGYRNSDIATYLEQSENEVILQISAARNALKMNTKTRVN